MQIIQNGRQQKRVRLRLFRHCQKRCKANLPAAREAHSLCLRRSALPFGFRVMWWKLSVPRAQAGKPAWTRHCRIGSRPTRCKACLLLRDGRGFLKGFLEWLFKLGNRFSNWGSVFYFIAQAALLTRHG